MFRWRWLSEEAISSRDDCKQTQYCLVMCSVICLCYSNDMPHISCIFRILFTFITQFILRPAPHAAPHLFRPFIFSSIPLIHLPPFLTLLSPFVPVVPSQTNGAHYRLAKNSPAAKSIHFFPSFCLFPSSERSYLFHLFLYIPQEGKE